MNTKRQYLLKYLGLILTLSTVLFSQFIDNTLNSIIPLPSDIFEFQEPQLSLTNHYTLIQSVQYGDSTASYQDDQGIQLFGRLPEIKSFQISAGYSQNQLKSQNIFNSSYSSDSLDFYTNNYTFGILGHYKHFKTKHFFQYSESQMEAPVYINKFPHSDTDKVLNDNFLDLLEPTFGDSIALNMNSTEFYHRQSLIFKYSNTVSPFFSFSMKTGTLNILESHINRGESRLKGIRESEFSLTPETKKLRYGLLFTPNQSVFVEHSKTSVSNSWVMDNSNYSYDIDSLGRSNISASSTFLGYENMSKNNRLFLYGGNGEIQMDYLITTPVLGYIDFFNIIPIVHQLDLYTNISYKLQSLDYSVTLRKGNFQFQPEIQFIHSDFILKSDAEANLEFGLASIDTSYAVQYDIQIYHFKLAAIYSLNKFNIAISASQLLPYIREIKRVGFPKPSDEEKADKTVYGGLSLKAKVWINF